MSVNTTVSLRLNETENKLIRTYAEMRGLTVSEFLREAALEEIRRELDASILRESYSLHIKKSQVFSDLEFRKKLGLV